MPESLSRRDLLVAGAAASMLMSSSANANPRSSEVTQSEADKLLADARKGDADNVAARMKFALPENTEPIFTFIPVDRSVRKR